MKIGILKEVKIQEYRVAMSPDRVRVLCNIRSSKGHNNHEIYVQSGAGLGIGHTDQEYKDAGAIVLNSMPEVFMKADLVTKVKEFTIEEISHTRPEQILFAFLHLAADKLQTEALLAKKVTAFAYETFTDRYNNLPLLTPMSEIAGKMSVQQGAFFLQKNNHGHGVLLGGVPGVNKAKTVIIGGGVVGINAAKIALGMGSKVTIMDISLEKLRYISDIFCGEVETVYSDPISIINNVKYASLLIGSVLIPGAEAPKVITEDCIQKMKPGTVFVDVAIDQGGCSETSIPTTYDNPTYVTHGVVHCCVVNIPGAVASTSSIALQNATFPYFLRIANSEGKISDLIKDRHFRDGLNIKQGKCTNKAIANSLNLPYTDPAVFNLN